MSGFPVRISRAALGLKRENRAAIVNPKNCVGADQFNLLLWQAAGNNVAGALAWISVDSAGARVGSGEAWNPDGNDLLRGTSSRTSTGIYVVTYAGSYPDMDDVDTPLALVSAKVSVRSSTAGLTAVWQLAGNVCTVKIATGGGTLTDAGFHLDVY